LRKLRRTKKKRKRKKKKKGEKEKEQNAEGNSDTSEVSNPHHLASVSKKLGLKVQAYLLTHTVPAYGYIIEEFDRPGALDVDKAKSLGAQGPQLGLLKAGKDIKLDNGNIIKSGDCVGPTKKGRKIAFLQDTSDSKLTINAVTDADVLIHEATFDDSMHTDAIHKGHSTAKMAGEFAKLTKVKLLILTHFSTRYLTKEEAERIAQNKKKSAKETTDVKNSNNKGKKPKKEEVVKKKDDEQEESDVVIENLVQEAIEAFGSPAVIAAKDFMIIQSQKDQGFLLS